ncbi:MAG: membrane protein insertase YidC, partial [Methylomarinum sp.]|nr:membrane protein insertase YidC [Methylomarinum sp.]
MDNIRFLLVIAFAMISYMLWEQWQLDYGPKPEIATLEQPTILEPGADLPTTGNVQAGSSTQNLEAVPVLEVPADKIITVKTDVFTLEIDTNGGTVRNLDLVQYPYEKENTVVNSMYALIGMDPAEKDLSPVRLFDSSGEKQFLAQSGLIASSGSAKAPDHHASFTAKNVNYELVEGQDTLTIPLEWTNNEGVVFTKTYTLTRGSYDISVV